MKRKSTFSAIGGYQPLLFCVGMYFVALFFSIFICSAVFYAISPNGAVVKNSQPAKIKTAMVSTSPNVLLTVTNK